MLSVGRQQARTLANIDPDLCRHMATLGHNVLRTRIDLVCMEYI